MNVSENLLLLDKKTERYVRKYIPHSADIEKLSKLYSIFAEPTRLKILSALMLSELCVTDLSIILGINQTTISHQLHRLSRNGIVNHKRLGKVKFYSVSNQYVDKILLLGVEFLGY